MRRLLLLLAALALPAAATPDLTTQRLVALGKLWADARYFHPYLAYRDIDWDAALVKAIPKVKAAANQDEYAAAIQSMLDALADPVTRVVRNTFWSIPHRKPEPRVRKDGDIAIIRYTALAPTPAAIQEIHDTYESLIGVRGIVCDVRYIPYPDYLLQQADAARILLTAPVTAPGQRTRMHSGLASPDNSGSGGYYSAFQTIAGRRFPGGPGAFEIPVVFLVNEHSGVPSVALALQAAGKGLIVAEGRLNEDPTVKTQRRKMPEGVEVQLRLGELIHDDGTGVVDADLVVPAANAADQDDSALRAAVELARHPKSAAAHSRPRLPALGAPPIDKSYSGMSYPDEGFRLMAAFRIWSVFEYFFPYKDLMGEDWDAVLDEFVPRMQAARNAREYHLSVAEMLTHVHDSHVFVSSPVLNDYFGVAPAAVEVRWIEQAPVVTAFLHDVAAKASGVELGDVVLQVDGEDADTRIARLGKYLAASTPQSLMNKVMGRLLAGPEGAAAAVRVRDRHGEIKQLRIPRSTLYYQAAGRELRPVFRLLSDDIGYADLTRLEVGQVDVMFDTFRDTRAIVLDMRGYPRGTAWAIAPRLTEKRDVPAARFDWPLATNPSGLFGEGVGYGAAMSFVQNIPNTGRWRYKGQTVMLIDDRAISQSEHSGLFYEAANGTRFIGSPTAGANGDVTYFFAPGGIRIPFSGHSVRHADGRQLQRVGLQPDIEVHPTIAGIRAGKDEVLDRAIQYIREGK